MRRRLSSSRGVGSSLHSPSLRIETMNSMASAVDLFAEAPEERGEGGRVAGGEVMECQRVR